MARKIDNDQRKYVRIPTVIPLEFTIVNQKKEIIWQTVYQGYTRNINQGGVCIELANLDDNIAAHLLEQDYLLCLNIDVPTRENPITIYADVRWLKKIKDSFPNKYKLGVCFLDIKEADVRSIVKYAMKLSRRPKQIFGVISLLALVAVSSSLHDIKVRYDNVQLVKEMVTLREAKESLDLELEGLEVRRVFLEETLDKANNEIMELEMKLAKVTGTVFSNYKTRINDLANNKVSLQESLKRLREKEDVLAKKREALSKSTQLLTKKRMDNMYNWIVLNQKVKTGLVPSYIGDRDLKSFAFTYDQALAVINFISHGDFNEAKKLMDFYLYKAKRYQGGFLNAYNVNDGSVIEWTAHVGPNVWLGMAILRYLEEKKDEKYFKLVVDIADWIRRFQDQEGGIKGGPTVAWYATEHNMDCYAFFMMLFKVTKDTKYYELAEKVMGWMKRNVYIPKEHRFMRGKNDPFIATDTVSFGIPALGPKRLYREGIDPEKLIEYMEKKTKVTTQFKNKKGKILEITGFDYTDPKKIGRPGVVSSEWTAQMVTAYNLMADYFEIRDAKKSKYYKDKADYYNSELDKMFIMLPYGRHNTGGLPYATGNSVNTGHGWLTPRSPYAVSVAGTAYALLGKMKINPFALKSQEESYI
ncbi:PilZ domain-containing protein [bacterium]